MKVTEEKFTILARQVGLKLASRSLEQMSRTGKMLPPREFYSLAASLAEREFEGFELTSEQIDRIPEAVTTAGLERLWTPQRAF